MENKDLSKTGLEIDIVDRLKVLEKMKEKGYNPYPYEFDKTNDVKEIVNDHDKFMDKYVKIAEEFIQLENMVELHFMI
ncbi:hypothetical protein DDW05_01845 [Candidatus Nanobsidianus stetteri]|uniref:Uncharacterized protein n=1 Tax=Nanobsidianus stetteri TaxID=1294122 RepID=A0A2T9WTG1_NANST|nr:hypothetical protein DDW05_01845 [Candidatus Nanobsidianus stetteri]